MQSPEVPNGSLAVRNSQRMQGHMVFVAAAQLDGGHTGDLVPGRSRVTAHNLGLWSKLVPFLFFARGTCCR